jgi:signal transduction histidine kinase
MNPLSAQEDVGALWLQTLQRAIGRASHDVKDALNGVSVNLEVIRSRAVRPDALASAVAPFGEAAAQQLERLTNLIEAILALSRPERSPADVGVTLRRVTTLCAASSSSADAAVRMIDDASVGSTMTRVRSDVVRLALLAPLLDVIAGSDNVNRASEVTCVLSGDDDAVLVVIAAADRRATMPESVADVARSAGIRWTEGEPDLSLSFPRA